MFIYLQNKRHEINQYGRQLSLAKETYKETFARLNLVATEIQQRKYLNNLTSDNKALVHNLSQFEEISDIGTATRSGDYPLNLSRACCLLLPYGSVAFGNFLVLEADIVAI